MIPPKKPRCKLTLARYPFLLSSFFLTLLMSACGGGGGADPNPPPRNAPNVASTNVRFGGEINAAPNTLFVSIKLCSPEDATNCMKIDNILVDTGSSGLRVFAQPLGTPPLSTLNLIQQTVTGNPGDNPIAQCMPFMQGSTWGPVKYASLQISEEIATNLPIQVIGDPGFTSVPDACAQGGDVLILNDVFTFGANGILGIGLFRQDCGINCTGNNPLDVYFNCDLNGNNCVTQAQLLTKQVPNPVTLFATNNNGVIITLPTIADSGAELVSGTITFGIDTTSNNSSTNENTILVDNSGFFTTQLSDGSYFEFSFLDTGSNGFFFNPVTPILACDTGFYCPGLTNTMAFTATISGASGSTPPVDVSFNIADAANLFETANTAFNDLGGPASDDAFGNNSFDWGLPFFFGRSVYVAIEGGATNKGDGPYVGF